MKIIFLKSSDIGPPKKKWIWVILWPVFEKMTPRKLSQAVGHYEVEIIYGLKIPKIIEWPKWADVRSGPESSYQVWRLKTSKINSEIKWLKIQFARCHSWNMLWQRLLLLTFQKMIFLKTTFLKSANFSDLGKVIKILCQKLTESLCRWKVEAENGFRHSLQMINSDGWDDMRWCRMMVFAATLILGRLSLKELPEGPQSPADGLVLS